MAVIVEVPVVKPFAMPVLRRIDAVAAVPEDHVIAPGTGSVELSLRSSTAAKSAVPPTIIVGFAGVIFKETGTTAPPTAKVTAGETTVPKVAVMALPPAETPVAKPPVLMVATAGVAEFQVTEDVMSEVLASLKVPVAVN